MIHHEATDAGRAGSFRIGWLLPKTVTWPASWTRPVLKRQHPDYTLMYVPRLVCRRTKGEGGRERQEGRERQRERARQREREKEPRVKERGENWTHQTLVARNLTCVQRSTVPPSARPVHLASPLQRLSPTGSTSTRSLFLRLLAPATTQYRVLWRIPAICLGISRVFAIF